MLVAFGPLTIDLVLPFLPALQSDLAISSAAAQLVITGATFGFAAGQLIAGPLSDAVGRRVPLAISAVLHILASVIAAITSDLAVLIPARFVQGAACTAAGVIVVALVRDLYTGRRLVTMLANLAVVASVTPIIVPSLGAQLTKVMDWRGSFVVVAVWGTVATIAAISLLPETLPVEHRHPGGLGPSLRNSVALLRRPRLLALAAASAAGWATGFGYLATAPFLYTRVFELNPDAYGLVFAATSVFTIAAAQFSGRVLMPRIGSRRVMLASGILSMIGAVAIAATVAAGWTRLEPVVMVITLALAGRALAMPAVQYLSLQGPANEAGSVTAILGAVSFAVAGIIMPPIGAFAEISLLPFAALVAVGAVVTGAVALAMSPDPPPVAEPLPRGA